MSKMVGGVPVDKTTTINLNEKCHEAWEVLYVELARQNPAMTDAMRANCETLFSRGYHAAFDEFSRLAAANPGASMVALDLSHPEDSPP